MTSYIGIIYFLWQNVVFASSSDVVGKNLIEGKQNAS